MSQDDDWKRIRSIVTPAFTSGKLRRMFPLFESSIKKLENYLEKVCKTENRSIEIKQVIAGFTIDVIASTSFGTNTDSNGDRDKFDPFVYHGQNMIQNLSIYRFFAILMLPVWMLKAFNITHAFVYESFSFMVNVIKTMLKQNAHNDNLINLLKEANISDEELKKLNFNKLQASTGEFLFNH